MGRERQKAKNRSSVSKVRPKTQGRTKSGKKKLNFAGNPLVARNWDKKLSLSQNYARLGLTSKLNAPTGGTEKKPSTEGGQPTIRPDPLAIIPSSALQAAQKPQTAKVERDPETGSILRIIQSEEQNDSSGNEANPTARSIRTIRAPLNDPLDSAATSKSESHFASTETIVPQLEAEALREASNISRRKRPRQQSEREQIWLARLVQRHGENVFAMFMDRKLNPMQNTEADIRKKLKSFEENGGKERIQDILKDV